jgi:uncharacterized protein with PQ loop repeat
VEIPTAAEMERRVHEILQQYGLEPNATLRALGATRSLISGSVPVAVLFEGRFKPNDVDIYCPESEEDTMRDILGAQEFQLDRETTIHYPKHLAIRRVLWLTKGSAKINLIIVKGDNAAVAIFQFHSTLVMNFICVYGTYLAYPELTLNGNSLVNTAFILDPTTMRRSAKCFAKYQERGFTFRSKASRARSI